MRREKNKCPFHDIEIPSNRPVVLTDSLNFVWKQDTKGYFLVKIENEKLCCGFVNPKHKMILELRGTNPGKIIKEISKRKLCNMDNMGYIASELMLARYCLEKKKRYIQR